MTFLPVFYGMRVRLMAKLSAKHQLVQDAVGTVVDVEFHPDEIIGMIGGITSIIRRGPVDMYI